MPQVRILSPRCDQKPDPNWYLSRPARGGFLLLTGTYAKAVPKIPTASAGLARLPRQLLTGMSTFRKLGPLMKEKAQGTHIGTSFLAVQSLLGLFRFTFASEPSVLPVGGLMASVL